MDLAQQLGEFVYNTAYNDIPDKVIDKAKQCMLDSIGVTIYGSQFEAPQITAAFVVETGGKAEASILGTPHKAPCFLAALANGVASHVADYDDSGGFGHPSGILMPATLALAEANPISGRDLLAAFILGNEVGSKLAQVMMFKHYEVGFHSTGTLGTIAAAVTSAKLLNLSPSQITNALGIAASSAGGIRQNFGTMTKCWHSGHAASAGMMAALVAQKGYDSSPQALDGKVGFIQAFQGNAEADFPVAQLGNPYSLMELMFKKYPSCHGTHAAVDAMLQLREQNNLSPQEVTSVECHGRPLMNSVLIYKDPRTGLQAKFSLEYCVSAALAVGHLGIAQFIDEAVLQPEVREIMKKVSSIEDAALGDLAMEKQLLAPSRVTVFLKDGREVSQTVEEARGGPRDPLPWAELEAKFLECAEQSLPVAQAKKALNLVHNLEQLDGVHDLTCLLTSS